MSTTTDIPYLTGEPNRANISNPRNESIKDNVKNVNSLIKFEILKPLGMVKMRLIFFHAEGSGPQALINWIKMACLEREESRSNLNANEHKNFDSTRSLTEVTLREDSVETPIPAPRTKFFKETKQNQSSSETGTVKLRAEPGRRGVRRSNSTCRGSSFEDRDPILSIPDPPSSSNTSTFDDSSSVFLPHKNTHTNSDFITWCYHNGIEILFPDAPEQAAEEIDNSTNSTKSWFPNSTSKFGISHHEDIACIDNICSKLISSCEYLNNSTRNVNLPLVLGGFGMGGTLALHLGLRYMPKISGFFPDKIFSFSAYLNLESKVFDHLNLEKTQILKNVSPDILIYHGLNDGYIEVDWASKTFGNLLNFIKKEKIKFEVGNFGHILAGEEFTCLEGWLLGDVYEETFV